MEFGSQRGPKSPKTKKNLNFFENHRTGSRWLVFVENWAKMRPNIDAKVRISFTTTEVIHQPQT